MSEIILDIHHLSKTFGTNVVLRDIDFSVSTGDVTCIIGASGSGKSTLLRCLNLLETPTSGKVLFKGVDITAPNVDINKIRCSIYQFCCITFNCRKRSKSSRDTP